MPRLTLLALALIVVTSCPKPPPTKPPKPPPEAPEDIGEPAPPPLDLGQAFGMRSNSTGGSEGVDGSVEVAVFLDSGTDQGGHYRSWIPGLNPDAGRKVSRVLESVGGGTPPDSSPVASPAPKLTAQAQRDQLLKRVEAGGIDVAG